MMNAIGKVLLFLSMGVIAACDHVDEDAVLLVYHNGNQYEILERGDMMDAGEPAYFVRYHSEDPSDEAVRGEERGDILGIVAMHIDTNEHQRVVLIAVEQEGRFFGLLAPRAISESLSVDEVLDFKPSK